MKLLVTGGAGFIGSNFIRHWLREHPSDDVVNYDALTYAGNLENLADIADNAHYRFVKGDIGDYNTARAALECVNVVVNFAAETHNDRSMIDPGIFVKTNVLGTQILLAA
ncbi:MAG: GDP-mannose 4,6-dehydratase, partial [Patescibacteria group bacterium]